ncbi:MAG TPA: SusC/RagA family protein, partial [Prevotella sp.]|nr:SusC/RagA family protein [Prevotella sp.]
ENGDPVIGAQVKVKGAKTGTVTDANGHFSLPDAKKGDIIVINYLGMDSRTMKATPGMKVNMQSQDHQLDEVLVVAFGQQKKSSFTGSAGVVKSDILDKKQLTNVFSGLQGEIAGVQMTNTSGSPTATPTFAIRGFGSINAGTSPLIIVDGAPYDGGWNNLNPNDVESITVLKDAASNALYGARGANGVIMITTKQGSHERATITFDAKWGSNSRATEDYDRITDPAQYYETYYKALYNYDVRDKGMSAYDAHIAANNTLGLTGDKGGLGYITYAVPDGQYLIGTNGRMNPNATLGNRVYYNGKFYTLTPDNWVDEAFRNGLRQEYNLNVTGGSDKFSFYASLGYLKNEGVVDYSDFDRYTARVKADYQAKKWLKIGANMNYTHTNQHDVGEGSQSLFDISTRFAPIYPVYLRDGDGNIMRDEHGKMYDYGSGENGGMNRPSDLEPARNVLQTNSLNANNTFADVMTLNGYVDITPIEGLKLTLNGTVTNNEWKNTQTVQAFYGNTVTTTPGGEVDKYNYQTYTLNFQQIANYSRSFGKHNATIMLGHENYKYNYNYLWGSRQQMFSYFKAQELNAAVKELHNGGSSSDYNTEGYFSRLMYDYDGRYFGQVSFRRDASSRFHPDHRWGNFYSFGGAWIISEEPWFKASWVDMLKLKASWGQQGNDDIGDYRYTDTYYLSNFNGEVAFVQNTVGNPNITWETNSNFNAGVEFELLKRRITGSVEYFHRTTTDMLCFVNVPFSGGYSGSWDNVGDMVNQGVELDLHFNPIRTKDINWMINLNATHYKNKVTKLHPDNKGSELDGYHGYVSTPYFIGEGLPLHTFRLKKYAGVNEEGQSTWYVRDPNTGEISTTTSSSSASYFKCGSADPSLYGGFSSTLSAFGFDLSVTFNYSLGGKALDYGYRSLMANPSSGVTGFSFHKDVLKAWSETNTNSDIPRFQYAVKDNDVSANDVSDRFLTNASTLTLQNINIGYTLPKRIVAKLGLTNVRIYASGENLYYWSKRKGFDPRSSFWGTSSETSYAQVRTFTGGLTIQF